MRTTRTPLTGVARKLRQQSTDVERRLWYHLRHRQMAGCKFRRQYVIGRYVADFACVEQRLVVEVDGGQHADRLAEDAHRTAVFLAKGFSVVRFWNDEVMTQLDEVLAVIHAQLVPGPSP